MHRYWSVREPFDAVVAFVPAHRLRGLQRDTVTYGEGAPPYNGFVGRVQRLLGVRLTSPLVR